eukprot:15166427-Ditylum_brightwellii.AAC.1
MDCNAQACYDHIIAIMTGLAMHKAGLPLKFSSYFIKALKQMEYYMSTTYGLSEQKNQHTKENPVHGNDPGSESAPPEWNFSSDIILKLYLKIAHECIIKDPTETIEQER